MLDDPAGLSMSLEEWEQYVGVKRVRAWGRDEEEFVSSLPPEEQDLVYELAVRLNIRPVEPGDFPPTDAGSDALLTRGGPLAEPSTNGQLVLT